jgi:golgi apyrase
LSKFGSDPEGIFDYLRPLIEHAKDEVPPHLHSETPIFLLATAGMRLLPEKQQEAVLRKVCQYLRDYTNFIVDESGPLGPCGASIRVISGEEEGLFGWIAVNYLMEGFSTSPHHRGTYGFLDMGGASTQIAFEPSDRSHDYTPVRLRLLNGEDITHNVFVTTWLGYGTNQARQRYVGRLIEQFEREKGHHESLVPDPCLPLGLKRTESSLHADVTNEHARKTHTFVGSGNFTQCLERSAPLLNKDAPCEELPCLFGGKKVPTIDFSVSRFIGVSEYWYSSEQVFNLGGAYDYVQYGRAASSFCMQDWSKIVYHHDQLKEEGHLGGDGELEKEGEVIGLGYWGPGLELSRLELQCFKAAWIVNVLHEGLGMPRIVDPGGNSTDHHAAEQIDNSAEDKGLGRPTFQSADTVGDTAITWTLGKMVLEASKEIRSSTGKNIPILDPLLPIPSDGRNSIDGDQHGISKHLPQPLRGSLYGVPIIFLLFYAIFCGVMVMTLRRTRKRLRIWFRRLRRRSNFRVERDDIIEMQDDGPANRSEGPPSPSPLAKFARRLASSFNSRSNSNGRVYNNHNSTSINGYYSDGSSSRAVNHFTNNYIRGENVARTTGTYSVSSRSSTPPVRMTGQSLDMHDATDPRAASALYNSLSSLNRSQNSSSLNLHPRTTTSSSLTSRSGAQTPVRSPT